VELDGVAHCCSNAYRPAAGLVKVNGYYPRAYALHADREEDHDGASSSRHREGERELVCRACAHSMRALMNFVFFTTVVNPLPMAGRPNYDLYVRYTGTVSCAPGVRCAVLTTVGLVQPRLGRLPPRVSFT
jgi:hypothetical protein